MSYIAPMIPENAPFDAAQRAWLNGFLAGLLSPGDGSGGASGAPGQIGNAAMAGRAADEPEDFPWHDPTLELDARLALAAGDHRQHHPEVRPEVQRAPAIPVDR